MRYNPISLINFSWYTMTMIVIVYHEILIKLNFIHILMEKQFSQILLGCIIFMIYLFIFLLCEYVCVWGGGGEGQITVSFTCDSQEQKHLASTSLLKRIVMEPHSISLEGDAHDA